LEFDKFEIWLDETSPDTRPSDVASAPEKFAARCQEVTRLSAVAFCLASETIPLDTFAGLMKGAKLLRIAQITVPASPLGTPFNSEIDRLKELVKIASREGVRVSLKTESGRLTADPRTAVELCQAVKGLGLTLDPSYYLGSPLGEQAFDMVYPHTYHVHLRDSRPGEVQVQVGLGELDYSRIISQLQRYKYNRALSIEILPQLCEADQIPLELRKLRMLLTTLL
jgi:sugar phosphate isomerase/epimerase